MDDSEDSKRRRERRTRWLFFFLSLVALGFYLGFFWKMDHAKKSVAASASWQKAVTADKY